MKNNNIGKEFIMKTYNEHLSESDQSQGVAQPPVELAYDMSKPLIDLIPAEDLTFDNLNLKTLIENRKSSRDYSTTKLTLKELSFLLYSTQGVKKHIVKETAKGTINVTFRTVPSAGARHPFETFILINHVEGIAPGLYRYLALKHKLVEINLSDEIASKITTASYNQEFIKTSAVTMIWVADLYRTSWRYVERAYRYIHLDAGHICQNLYLSAESIDFGVCAIASFNDSELNKLMELDGENQFVVYLATVGHNK